MSILTYNGVTIPRILTRAVDYTAMFSDDHTEYLHTEVMVNVHGLFATEDGQSPAALFPTIHRVLMLPRQRLTFLVGPNNLIDSDASTDQKLGPIPQSCNLSKFVSDRTIAVDYRIATYLNPGAAGAAILSHRWSESLSRDENFYATWTRTGTVIGNSFMDLGNATTRRTFYPAACAGFKRVGFNWSLSQDGLRLDYSFSDREMTNQFVGKATTCGGRYSESTPTGATRTGRCTIKLTAPRNYSKASLITDAVFAVIGKFNRIPLDGGRKLRIRQVVASEALFENEVELTVEAQWCPERPNQQLFSLPMVGGAFGGTLPGTVMDAAVDSQVDSTWIINLAEKEPE